MPPTDAWLIFQQIMAGLDRQTAQVLTSLWGQATTPEAKYAVLMDVLPGAVEELSGVGAQAAVDLYTELRTEAAVRSAYTPTPTPGVPVEQTEAMIRNATKGWLDGRDATKVLSQLSGGTRRLVRYPARDTIIANTRRDPARPRFARVASPRACPWCLMLVSRGAVYREETGRFRAHDFCRCDATPVFNDSQIPEQSRQLAEEWDQVTAGTNGPEEAQAAWAEHVRAHSDFYGYHSPTSTGAGGGGGNLPGKLAATGGPDDPRDTARRLLAIAREAEPAITSDVEAAITTVGATRARAGSVLKTEDSLTRKVSLIEGLGFDTDDLVDVIRYTAVADETSYWRASNALVARLESEGHTLVRDRVSWTDPGYRGRNTVFRSPAGQLFEVQSHTLASLAAAEETHGLYETVRQANTPSAVKEYLRGAADAIFAEVPIPT